VIVDVDAGTVHWRAERFLAGFGDGTQRTYAYHLADHLRWLAATGRREDTVGVGDLRRYLGLCGMEHAGPFGVPWLERPLGASALGVRAACLKGYYLDLTTAEGVNGELRAALSVSRLPGAAGRDRSFLGHLGWPAPANPLVSLSPPRRHPRMLPDGAAAAMAAAVRTARDRMIVTWLADSGCFSGGCKALEQDILSVVAGHGLDQQGRLGNTCCTRRPVGCFVTVKSASNRSSAPPEICCETSPGCLRRNVMRQAEDPGRRDADRGIVRPVVLRPAPGEGSPVRGAGRAARARGAAAEPERRAGQDRQGGRAAGRDRAGRSGGPARRWSPPTTST
jgi:hypothetical protein